MILPRYKYVILQPFLEIGNEVGLPSDRSEALARSILPSLWTAMVVGLKRHNRPRVFGHRNGVKAVREVTEASAELGIKIFNSLCLLQRELEETKSRGEHLDEVVREDSQRRTEYAE